MAKGEIFVLRCGTYVDVIRVGGPKGSQLHSGSRAELDSTPSTTL